MNILIKKSNFSVSLSLTLLKLVGFWVPSGLRGWQRTAYYAYSTFCFMFLLGIYIIIQVVDLFLIWGNLPLMTGTAFLLFTNLAEAAKTFNILARRQRLQEMIDEADDELAAEVGEGREIVDRCNREMVVLQMLYFCLTTVTIAGWAGSAERNQLPLRAWYPYDTSASPAYELTYSHQVVALFIAAFVNVAQDTLVAALVAQCSCRLRLVQLALTTLRRHLPVTRHYRLTKDQESELMSRLRVIVQRHQAALAAVGQLQASFSAPTFAQFIVSMVIICVTAFQLASQIGNPVRLVSMGTYLLNMVFQVFIYCYQGNQLTEMSVEVSRAAYSAPWCATSTGPRRVLLVLMTRAHQPARLSAGGFTTLSLASFMAVIKTSYSFFTVLQQIEERK